MRMILRYLLLFILSFCPEKFGYAEEFSRLQSQYLSLRNTDVDFKKSNQWKTLAEKFQALSLQNKDKAGQSIYNASIIYEGLFRAKGEKEFLDRAISLYERIPRDLPGDEFADDALLHVGDIYANDLSNIPEAKRRYLEIVDEYLAGDIVGIAKARIKLIEEGKGNLIVDSHNSEPIVSNLPLVIIDPGHGGEDYGAKGKGGLLEKDVVLDVALKLLTLSKQEQIFQARLTRKGDSFVPLMERTNLANDFDAALFVSLHVNASPDANVSGIETYYLDNTNEKSSQKLAERENQYFETEGVGDLNFMLSDLIQNAKLGDSITVANIMQKSMISHMTQKWGKQNNLGVKKAPFYVLVGTHIPCILVEMYFVSDEKDERNLAKSEFRTSLAEGLNSGISKYLSRASK